MSDTSTPAKVRNSNLELYRIITMVLIVAHHYVVNSGLMSTGGPIESDPLSFHSLFLLLFGAWGKVCINCYVLITGYFMCEKNITLKKFLKLVCVVEFYQVLIFGIFCVTGFEELSLVSLIKALIPVRAISDNFESVFIVFFLSIPFLNIVIRNMTERQHLRLLALLTFSYIILGTLPGFFVTMNYLSWFMVLFFIASYLRLYPKRIFGDTESWRIATIVCIIISSVSVIAMTMLSARWHRDGLLSYYFVTDSNTLLAVLTGISSFMYFKNVDIPQSRLINTVGATTFGVLLIHANSDAMRQWLWVDTLNNVSTYYSPWGYIHAILSVAVVFVICSFLDLLRIRLIEKPFFDALDKRLPQIVSWYEHIESRLFEKLHVQ